jgi:hypothetical protein
MLAASTFAANTEDEILKRYIQEGDVSILTPLLEKLTPTEISKRLKTIANPNALNIARESFIIAETAPQVNFDTATMAVDSANVIHIVFVEQQQIPERDNLGNETRWQDRILYVNNQGGKWSKPLTILEDEIYIHKLKLLVDDQNGIQLFAAGFNISTHNTARGIFPGGYEIYTMQKSKNSEWSTPETIVNHPKLLHMFDVCFDSKKNLHLVWAPWEGNDVLELLHYRVRSTSGWQKEEVLPEVPNRNASHPQIQCMESGINVFAAGQTTDYNKLSLYQWKRISKGWAQPALIAEPLYDFDFSLLSSGGQVAISIPYGKRFAIYSGDGYKGLKQISELYLAKSEDYETNFPFVFGKDNSFVYLVPYKNGVLVVSKKLNQQPTAVLLTETPDEDRWAGIRILMATKNEYISLFNIQDAARQQKLIINRLPVNTSNWQTLVKTASLLRGRDGLRDSELCLLTKEVMKQASTAEKEDHVLTAINKYLYLIANFSNLKGDCEYSYYAMTELNRLYMKGSDADRSEMEAAIRKNADKLKELPRMLDGMKEIHSCQLEVSKKAFSEMPINSEMKQAFEDEKNGAEDSPSEYEIKSSQQTVNEIKNRAVEDVYWRTPFTFGNKCHFGFMKIAELLFDPDPRIRLNAAWALHSYDPQRSLPFLKVLLTDPGCFFFKFTHTDSDVLPDYKAIKISEEVKMLLEWSS